LLGSSVGGVSTYTILNIRCEMGCLIGDALNRDEAVKLFKEITCACRLGISSVSLISPDQNLDGYELHIKSFLDRVDRIKIQNILERYQLVWKEEKDTIIIYKPKEA
jgi:hypothetical protein